MVLSKNVLSRYNEGIHPHLYSIFFTKTVIDFSRIKQYLMLKAAISYVKEPSVDRKKFLIWTRFFSSATLELEPTLLLVSQLSTVSTLDKLTRLKIIDVSKILISTPIPKLYATSTLLRTDLSSSTHLLTLLIRHELPMMKKRAR